MNTHLSQDFTKRILREYTLHFLVPSDDCIQLCKTLLQQQGHMLTSSVTSPQVASFYAANGFYVLLDNHLLEDPTAAHDPAAWAQLLAQLVCADLIPNLWIVDFFYLVRELVCSCEALLTASCCGLFS